MSNGTGGLLTPPLATDALRARCGVDIDRRWMEALERVCKVQRQKRRRKNQAVVVGCQ